MSSFISFNQTRAAIVNKTVRSDWRYLGRIQKIVLFRRSSVVEQLTVNQLVVGSTPTVGAKNVERWLSG